MSADSGVADDLSPPWEETIACGNLPEPDHEARMEAISSQANTIVLDQLRDNIGTLPEPMKSSPADTYYMDQVILIVGHLLHRRDAMRLALWMRSRWIFCQALTINEHYAVDGEPLGLVQAQLAPYRCAPVTLQ